jgi:hypothetical protein
MDMNTKIYRFTASKLRFDQVNCFITSKSKSLMFDRFIALRKLVDSSLQI